MASKGGTGAPPEGAGQVLVLASLLRQGVVLQPERVELLRSALTQGLKFFDEYNEARVQLAFALFDPAMRDALFEILFLLNCNDPVLAAVNFQPLRQEARTGPEPPAAHANLYVEGAPAGVQGIDKLSPRFRADYEAHIRKTFGLPATAKSQSPVIYCVASVGSIATVGHKSEDSDLDLQINYTLTPSAFDGGTWSNAELRAALARETAWWEAYLLASHKGRSVPPEALQGFKAKAADAVARAYPHLTGHLVTEARPLDAALRDAGNAGLRNQVLNELIALIKRAPQVADPEALRRREELLRTRAGRIGDYIARKYPAAEIHLFLNSLADFRQARYSSTLESGESSGSAYGLILNHDTLMPGVQFTPAVPAHFVFPASANNDPGVYARLVDYLQFGLLDLYREARERLVDLGPAPDLQPDYVAGHPGAMYWEAFKASSGNLPKATLNLLRYEMLLDRRHLKTVIQLIKEPAILDGLVSRPADAVASKAQQERANQDRAGTPPWALLDLEAALPALRRDPWWLRYKALKIAFGERDGVTELHEPERDAISRLMDLAFALHVRISDVFPRPGAPRKPESPREKALAAFLQLAFPAGSPRRAVLERIFMGEVQAVNTFEAQLRDVFRRGLNRIGNKLSAFPSERKEQKEEHTLWLRYYMDHFEPLPQVVQRSILQHLKVARGRVQTGYVPGEGWFFKSLQRESGFGKRFDPAGALAVLPDEVVLIEKTHFLHGLAYCIVNGYYGVLNRGTLKERRTALEFDAKRLDMGHRAHNELAFIRPDMVGRILERIEGFFTPREISYAERIGKPRRVVEVLAFVNLWRFGELALLYQDDAGTWACEAFEHPQMVERPEQYTATAERLLAAKPIHASLSAFLQRKKTRVTEIRFASWINPLSVKTTQAGPSALREKELQVQFERLVRWVHGAHARPPVPAPPAPGGPPGGGL